MAARSFQSCVLVVESTLSYENAFPSGIFLAAINGSGVDSVFGSAAQPQGITAWLHSLDCANQKFKLVMSGMVEGEYFDPLIAAFTKTGVLAIAAVMGHLLYI